MKRMFQLFLGTALEFFRNKQQARNWDKLILAWDWEKSVVSISGVRLYYENIKGPTDKLDFLNSSHLMHRKREILILTIISEILTINSFLCPDSKNLIKNVQFIYFN